MEEVIKQFKSLRSSGIDITALSDKEALLFWQNAKKNIAITTIEKMYCYFICAQYYTKLRQYEKSNEELHLALSLLEHPTHTKKILSIKQHLAEQLMDIGQYEAALKEFVEISTISIEYGLIDNYVLALLGKAELCKRYGDYTMELRYYQKIDSIDRAIKHHSLRLHYKLQRLACLIELHRSTAAEELLQECNELAILVNNKTLTIQVSLYKAKLLRHQRKFNEALQILADVPHPICFTASEPRTFRWLSIMLQREIIHCLKGVGKAHWQEMLLLNIEKRFTNINSPILEKQFYHSLAHIYTQQCNFKQALAYSKKAYDIETMLIKTIPIHELGKAQLKRLKSFELQLKLIVSEQENQQLRETTEHQKHTVAKLQKDVFTDPLTRLHNRRWLDMKLKDLLIKNTPFILLIIDIDHFKSINDDLSHLVGDKAIINVSSKLLSYFHDKNASCVRFGGEEFLVILEEKDLEVAVLHAQNYRRNIHQFDWYPILGDRGLTVSIGITLYRYGENTQRTFYRADKALYRAKANGRNQICVE